jgi:NAD(P)-dependent dehydrogenase (short-subunit alcohol dehydrogenase family)
VALGEAGATVYCTGRSTRQRRSEYDRPETIEETAELVTAAGGVGIAVPVDHLEADQVKALVQRIEAESGRLDVLVNDIWGGELLFEWSSPVWEHDLENGLRILRLAIDTHLITSHFALPLLIRQPGGLVVEMTDGTREYNADHYPAGMLGCAGGVGMERYDGGRRRRRVSATITRTGRVSTAATAAPPVTDAPAQSGRCKPAGMVVRTVFPRKQFVRIVPRPRARSARPLPVTTFRTTRLPRGRHGGPGSGIAGLNET